MLTKVTFLQKANPRFDVALVNTLSIRNFEPFEDIFTTNFLKHLIFFFNKFNSQKGQNGFITVFHFFLCFHKIVLLNWWKSEAKLPVVTIWNIPLNVFSWNATQKLTFHTCYSNVFGCKAINKEMRTASTTKGLLYNKSGLSGFEKAPQKTSKP